MTAPIRPEPSGSLYDEYLRSKGGGGQSASLYDQYRKQKADTGNIDLRKDIGDLRNQIESTGTAGARHPAQESTDYAAPGILGSVQKGAEALVSGLPGAQRAVSGYRGILALLGGQGIEGAANEVDRSLTGQRADVASLPKKARIPLQIAGSLPAAAAAAPLGVLGGGAAFGAAAGADQDANSIVDRAKNTALGGVLGAAFAKGSQVAGRGAANLSNRLGITDAIGKAVNKVSPELAAAMGTRGQVNSALSDRQQILDKIGDTGESAGQTLLGKVATKKATAKTLYDAARADTRALDDPELLDHLNDPQVKQVFQRVGAIREAMGNPLPRTAIPDQVPLALQKMGVSPARYAELQALGQSRRVPVSGVDILPPELLGEQATGVEMPDPQSLHQVKRALRQIIQGRMNSELPLSQDEALALLPKVNAIQAKLGELSPAWSKADAFYAHASGEEQGLKKGFDAFRVSKNPTASKLETDSPEALRDWISNPRYGAEPGAAMADRIQAFQQGGRQAMAGQVRGAPVTKDLSAILKVPSLAPTETGSKVRSLMFDSPEESRGLEQLLASFRGASPGATTGDAAHIPTTHYGVLRSLVRGVTQEPDKIATGRGQSLLADRLGSSELLRGEIANSQVGGKLADLLKTVAGISLGGQVAR